MPIQLDVTGAVTQAACRRLVWPELASCLRVYDNSLVWADGNTSLTVDVTEVAPKATASQMEVSDLELPAQVSSVPQSVLQSQGVNDLVTAMRPFGELFYRSGATMASSDELHIRVTGKQGHGGMPWNTIDPITTSALIISGLQTVVSRRVNLAVSPAVVTVAAFAEA